MEINSSDLIFSANILYQISRYNQAIDYLKKLIAVEPKFSHKTCQLFGNVFKPLIDKTRNTMTNLQNFYNECGLNNNVQRADCISEYIKKANDQLLFYCNEAISLIDEYLLPNAEDEWAQCFFYRSKGDYYRYISEGCNNEDVKDAIANAIKSYGISLELCNAHLSLADPLRLGTILNFAIFKHDHLKACEEAIEMLQQGRRDGEDNLNELDSSNKTESLQILGAFRTNLTQWEEGGH